VNDGGTHPVLVGLAPYRLRLRLNARHAVKQRHSAVQNAQRALHLQACRILWRCPPEAAMTGEDAMTHHAARRLERSAEAKAWVWGPGQQAGQHKQKAPLW